MVAGGRSLLVASYGRCCWCFRGRFRSTTSRPRRHWARRMPLLACFSGWLFAAPWWDRRAAFDRGSSQADPLVRIIEPPELHVASCRSETVTVQKQAAGMQMLLSTFQLFAAHEHRLVGSSLSQPEPGRVKTYAGPAQQPTRAVFPSDESATKRPNSNERSPRLIHPRSWALASSAGRSSALRVQLDPESA